MNHQEIIEIVNARNALKVLGDLNTRFLENCAKNPSSQEFQSRLDVSGSTVSVDCFGHTAKAECRYVRTLTGEFAAEYRFEVAQGDSRIEVWRVYVTTNGRLVLDPGAEEALCDYNNAYIANHMCGRVLLGSLRSSLFSVSVPEGG